MNKKHVSLLIGSCVMCAAHCVANDLIPGNVVNTLLAGLAQTANNQGYSVGSSSKINWDTDKKPINPSNPTETLKEMAQNPNQRDQVYAICQKTLKSVADQTKKNADSYEPPKNSEGKDVSSDPIVPCDPNALRVDPLVVKMLAAAGVNPTTLGVVFMELPDSLPLNDADKKTSALEKWNSLLDLLQKFTFSRF